MKGVRKGYGTVRLKGGVLYGTWYFYYYPKKYVFYYLHLNACRQENVLGRWSNGHMVEAFCDNPTLRCNVPVANVPVGKFVRDRLRFCAHFLKVPQHFRWDLWVRGSGGKTQVHLRGFARVLG